MKKTLILTSVLILSGCIASNQTNTNPSMNNSKISIEQQNQKLFEFSKEFPDNVSFWKSCEDYNKSRTMLVTVDTELFNKIVQSFKKVATECKAFGSRFAVGDTVYSDCNTCTSKEAKLCANASREYVELVNSPFFGSQLTFLQYLEIDNLLAKSADTHIKVEELCSGTNVSEELKAEAESFKHEDKSLVEEKQKFKKQYEAAKEAQNADNCGIMPCHFIKQAAESTPKAKEI